ncbi:GNAT family N-acetyltransferase [Paracoccus onubensis]|uniref:GNAT family N-acetyltransferase n=1 Tax=Paracoccus onubensis TaxID=1675788 RepID=A0A418SUG2_9RHOB|nr:GNAT family N-acetyltransferase [Paracoccus onubensis]RJE84529.1 GNAT family N-acetyltransferase [Paracoccus onubensis]
MAHTEQLAPVILSEGHVEQAMELSAEAGWNQLPADWLLFLKQGRIFGLFDGDVLIATAAIMPYGDDFAWIGMVLTRKAWRGRGFGTSLLKTCIAELEGQGRSAWLDATPSGEPIYRGLGFEPVSDFARWQGAGTGNRGNDLRPADAAKTDAAAIEAANAAFGADRTAFLRDLATRCPAARQSTKGAFSFGRDGRIATQIGPVVGTDDTAVAGLVDHVLSVLEGPVFLDVAERCRKLTELLKARGFTRQRPFLRMRKGPHGTPGNPRDTAVIAGPEFG